MIRRAIARSIAAVVVLFSMEGLVWIAAVLLVGSAVCGWIQTPLQGVIRGYSLSVFAHLVPADGLTNRPRLLFAALPCVVTAAVALYGTIARRRRWLEVHAGILTLACVLLTPIVLTARHPLLVEELIDQNEERDAIRAFAAAIRNPLTLPYSATLPALNVAGATTLGARAESVLQLMGYGWWFALAGAGLLTACGLRFVTGRHAGLALGGWGGLAVLGGIIVAAPAVEAEYHRVRGEAAYAAGQYADARDRFEAALRVAPALGENQAFAYRRGATLVRLGDRTSPTARLFVARNLREAGDPARAELELKSALLTEPDWRLLRRRLAELYADRGVTDFAELADPWDGKFRPSRAETTWAKADALDASMLRIRYFFAHAYHRIDARDQRRAIDQTQRLVGLIRDRGVLSDAYALLGDCYFKSRDDVTARAMYAKAMETVPLVKMINLKAQKGLLGL